MLNKENFFVEFLLAQHETHGFPESDGSFVPGFLTFERLLAKLFTDADLRVRVTHRFVGVKNAYFATDNDVHFGCLLSRGINGFSPCKFNAVHHPRDRVHRVAVIVIKEGNFTL